MKNYIRERVLKIANYVLTQNTTIRDAAKYFGVSKSTVHLDLSKRLKKINCSLYEKIKIIFNNNFNEKHLRGGESTKNKYKKREK